MARRDLKFIRTRRHRATEFLFFSVPLCSNLYFAYKMHLILSLLEHGVTEPQSLLFSVPPCLCVQSFILLAKFTSIPPESKRNHHLLVFDIVASAKNNPLQLQSAHFYHQLWPIPFSTIGNFYSQAAS